MKNAFLLTDNPIAVENGAKTGVTEFTVATRFPHLFEGLDGVTAYKLVEKPNDACYPRLALLSLDDDATVDAVIEARLGKGAELIVAAAYSLDETGAIEVRTHLSPVQLLHKLGLLDGVSVVGGVHLDRDDVDLMAQSGARLILCPSSSMGYGYGFPHYVMAKRKLTVLLGSGDNAYNQSGDMLFEARLLMLGTNCDMRSKSAVSKEEVSALINADTAELY